jgi:hypothetical protein
MVFTKHLREGIKRGRITTSVRFWLTARVKAGGRYAMDEGHIVVDSIERITKSKITPKLVRESGFKDLDHLLEVARHGKGEKIFLVRFHYLRPGEWDRTP